MAYSVSSSSTHFGGGSDHLAQDLSPGTRLMAGPLSLFVLQPQPLSLETSTLITRWPGWESITHSWMGVLLCNPEEVG